MQTTLQQNHYKNSFELEMLGFELIGDTYTKVTESLYDKNTKVLEQAYEEDEDDKKVAVMVTAQYWNSPVEENEGDDCTEEYIGSYDFFTGYHSKRNSLINRIF